MSLAAEMCQNESLNESENTSSDKSPSDEEPPSSGQPIDVEVVVDDDVRFSLDERRIDQAIQLAAADQGFSRGTICVRICSDATIRVLNAKHLSHDYATDVISFGYAADAPHLEGELIASIDTARREAARAGWSDENELLLYIVHGVLHNAGMDDHDPSDRAEMRAAETRIFKQLGVDEILRCGADSIPDIGIPADRESRS